MTYEEWYANNEMAGWTEAEYMLGFKAWNAGFDEAKSLTFEKFPKAPRPSIAELEEMLAEDDVSVFVNPDGSLSAAKGGNK